MKLIPHRNRFFSVAGWKKGDAPQLLERMPVVRPEVFADLTRNPEVPL
jgi:hypothetical protein